MSYLLHPYQKQNNYFALFEGWIMLICNLIRYTYKYKLETKEWSKSFEIVKHEIIENIKLLKEESLQRKYFLEGNWLGDGGLIYKARTTLILGILCALELYLKEKDNRYEIDARIKDMVKNNIKSLWFWGESAFPLFLNIIHFLEKVDESQLSKNLLDTLMLVILEKNGNKNTSSITIPNPYYSSTDVLEAILVDDKKIEFFSFKGSSYILDSLIEMEVRRGDREILEKNWRRITYIQLKSFKPPSTEDIFLWRCEEGENHSEFPKITQSWSELNKEAKSSKGIPEIYWAYEDLLRFFLIVYPHRINKYIVRVLEKKK